MTLKDFIQKNRPTVIFSFSMIFSLICLSTNITEQLKTIRSFFVYFLYFTYKPIYEVIDYPIRITNKFIVIPYLYEENLKLKDLLKKKYLKNLQIEELNQKYLREIYLDEILKNSKYKFIDSKVIFRDYQNWYDYCTINIPQNYETVKEDMPVITNPEPDKFYLVGRIWTIEKNIAKVLLITNPLSAVAVKIKNKNVEGVVLGSGSVDLIMDYVLEEDDIRIGDIIVTSGLNNIPENIEVGEVTKIERSTTPGFKKATIKLKFNINSLKNLLIILSQ